MNIKLSIILFFCILETSVLGVQLRDGSDIPLKKVDETWEKLERYQELAEKEYLSRPLWVLWCVVVREKNLNVLEAKVLSQSIFPICKEVKLCDDQGNIDLETAAIIKAAYRGTSDGKLYTFEYPVTTTFSERLWRTFIGDRSGKKRRLG